MDASVSLPDPGEFDRGTQNGHAAGLVIDDLRPFDPDAELPGDGVLPLDAADVGEVLALPGFDLTADVIDEQTHALEAAFRAELDRLDHDRYAALDGSSCNLAQEKDYDEKLLPKFESLTWSDLHTCPSWCADNGLPAHGDGFDTTPEAEVPHRGVPHDIPTKHGGQGIDHTGRARVSLQLEQDRDLTTGPVITLSVVICGVEHTAWLTAAEATALHRILGQMLDDTTGRS